MNIEYAITSECITKKFKEFELEVENLRIPKGMATALIGENGAGKTTLLNILAGIRLDYEGVVKYFEECESLAKFDARHLDLDRHKSDIGYTGPGNYYMPHWTIQQVEEISALLFADFDRNMFEQWCRDLAVFTPDSSMKNKKVSTLSDGMRMKLMLSGVLARDCRLLLLDEPASPLDPLMRDRLCEIIRDYLTEGNGETSVFFSTHNISDMENVTDYAIIMEQGRIVEAGFVEDLKEKYILVKGESTEADAARDILYSISTNPYGFEGICLKEDLDKLAGWNVTREIPSLYQISVAVMKKYSRMRLNRR